MKRLLIAICLVFILSSTCQAAQPSFTKNGSTTLSFSQGPDYPKGDIVSVATAYVVTAGAVSYRYDKGVKYIDILLEWTDKTPLRKVDFDGGFVWSTMTQIAGQSLVNWYYNVAIGGKNTFTYTNETGLARTVILMNDLSEFKQNSSLGFTGKLILRVEL